VFLCDLNEIAAGVIQNGRGDRSHLNGRLGEVNSGVAFNRLDRRALFVRVAGMSAAPTLLAERE
jgi:hypothetical protein